MKKWVLTVREDVCAANGKDVNATELLGVMKLWGEVNEFEKEIAAVKVDYQTTVDNLTAHIASIKAHDLTDDEVALVNAYRACKATVTEGYKTRISDLEVMLEDIKAEEEKRIEQIIAIFRGNN
jgi:hypothetical protein